MSQPTFDYHAGTPWVLNDEMETVLAAAIEREPVGRASDLVADEEVRQLRSSEAYRERVRAAYDDAGVNLSSVTLLSSDRSLSYAEQVQADLARWTAKFDAVDWLTKVTSPAQARRVAADDGVGIVLNTQNLGKAIEGDVDEVERLYNQGVRIMQLTYNRQNEVGTGCTDRSDGGLSNHGLEVVDRMNDLGAVVDLSHCGRETTIDALEHSDAPVAVTHSCCQAVYDHDRGKSDAELEALRDADGYMGIVAVPFFLTDESSPSFDVFFEHLEHAVEVLGPERVGVGSDFSSIDRGYPTALKEGTMELLKEVGFREEHGVELGAGFGAMERYQDWPVVREGLEERYDEATVRKILGENFLRFWERVVDAADAG